jgi:ATP-dependent 26S proteasome regulatory subunit
VIFATNLAQNIDDAFSRRMHFVVDFPMPDATGREALWRGMLPSSAPVATDVDFGFLARRFALSGGDIRNIVLDSAYRAAQEDAEIGMRHLLRGVAHQIAKRGKVPSTGEFREYAGLLAAEVHG